MLDQIANLNPIPPPTHSDLLFQVCPSSCPNSFPLQLCFVGIDRERNGAGDGLALLTGEYVTGHHPPLQGPASICYVYLHGYVSPEASPKYLGARGPIDECVWDVHVVHVLSSDFLREYGTNFHEHMISYVRQIQRSMNMVQSASECL